MGSSWPGWPSLLPDGQYRAELEYTKERPTVTERWQYRFRNFSRAYSLLRQAFNRDMDELNDLEKEGIIQRFEYTFELSWNTLKDRLEYDGVLMESVTPRNVIRTATAAGLIVDGQTWIDMLEDRRNTSHL